MDFSLLKKISIVILSVFAAPVIGSPYEASDQPIIDALYQAIKDRDVGKAERLMADNSEIINYSDASCDAAKLKDIDLLKIFVGKIPKKHTAGVVGWAVRCAATVDGNVAILRWLVSEGADLNQTSKNPAQPNFTSLDIAAKAGASSNAAWIASQGGRANVTDVSSIPQTTAPYQRVELLYSANPPAARYKRSLKENASTSADSTSDQTTETTRQGQSTIAVITDVAAEAARILQAQKQSQTRYLPDVRGASVSQETCRCGPDYIACLTRGQQRAGLRVVISSNGPEQKIGLLDKMGTPSSAHSYNTRTGQCEGVTR